MNENRKCQMYIVFGDEEYRSNPNFKNNLEANPYNYFYNKVSSPIDARLFNESFMQEYGKVWNILKAKNIKVANKIIFIIPSEDYRAGVNKLIEDLHYVGDIKVFPKKEEKKEEEPKQENIVSATPVETVVPPTPPVVEPPKAPIPTINTNVLAEEPLPQNIEEVKPEIPKPQTNIPNPYYNPNDNVFYKPHENPNNGVVINPSVAAMPAGKHEDDGFEDLRKADKGKISLALIVFIISFILLVASILLLFFID